jgi:hypothetical protein
MLVISPNERRKLNSDEGRIETREELAVVGEAVKKGRQLKNE